MGTHSKIVFQERCNGQTVVYAMVEWEYSGNFGHAGRILATFLKSVKLVTWIQITSSKSNSQCRENVVPCNGFGDLVAQFFIKTRKFVDKGRIKLCPACDTDPYGDFNYYVTYTGGEVRVQVKVPSWEEEDEIKMCCEISVDEFLDMCTEGPIETLADRPEAFMDKNVLWWTKPNISGYDIESFQITARVPGKPIESPIESPIEIPVRTGEQQYMGFNLDSNTLDWNTPYEITVTAKYSCRHGSRHVCNGQPSEVISYQRKAADKVAGTKSLIFFGGDAAIYAVIYQQWNGDLQGVGHTLAKFLQWWNENVHDQDFGSIVASFITNTKENSPGHPFYFCPAVADQAEEYNYFVTSNGEKLSIRVNNSAEMSVEEFQEMCGITTVKHLKQHCITVIMRALLEQKSLEPSELESRLPDYVPTMVKKSIVDALFASPTALTPAGNTSEVSSKGKCSCWKAMKQRAFTNPNIGPPPIKFLKTDTF